MATQFSDVPFSSQVKAEFASVRQLRDLPNVDVPTTIV